MAITDREKQARAVAGIQTRDQLYAQANADLQRLDSLATQATALKQGMLDSVAAIEGVYEQADIDSTNNILADVVTTATAVCNKIQAAVDLS